MKPPRDLAGYDPIATAGNCVWDSAEAERVLAFFPKFLQHIEGSIAGRPLEPNPWERDFLSTVFGWRRPDGRRRYREFFVGIPRKNSKTTVCAGLSLYMLLCDTNQGPQCYLAAADKVQASVLFRPAAAMVQANKELSRRCQIYLQDKRIVCQANNGFIRTLTGEASRQHGLGPHFFVIDEIHNQPDRELYDVLRSGTGARPEALYGSITTAGHDRDSICYELWDYARKVRSGTVDDSTFLPLVYEAGENEDWQDPDVWARCNPNLGRSLTEDHLAEEFQRACTTPSYENTFKNLHLNLWTEAESRWLSSDSWQACQAEIPDLTGRSCVAGLDLGSTDDLTALVYVFPHENRFIVKAHFFCPAETISASRKRYQSQYRKWVESGWLTETPGSATDYAFVRQRILDDAKRYHIEEIAYDPWQAEDTQQRLAEAGFEMTKVQQSFAGLWPGVKAVEESLLAGTLAHDGNECLTWQVASTVVETDANGNRKPAKKKSHGEAGTKGKIDGVVALCMAMSRAVVSTGNVYDQRGVLTI